MKKIICTLFLIIPLFSTVAEELTSIKKNLLQNRIVKTKDFDGLSYAICEALMDLNISKMCSLMAISFMQNKKDENLLERIKESGMTFQASYGDRDVLIKMFKEKNEYYRININIKNQRTTKEIYTAADYNRIFNAIETSIFINKLEAKLGVEND
jgi:hypothetical protein